MKYKLSARSRARLVGVHPDLVQVVERAITVTLVDFSVVEGPRTLGRQRRLFELGKSRTMRSRHLPASNQCGLACAIDLAPWIDGQISWEPAGFEPVADAVKSSAFALDVPLEWGFDLWQWDSAHFQLPWQSHP